MAVTAHYMLKIDDDLVMKSRLIAFRHITGSHTGMALGKEMVKILDELGIMNRVSSCSFASVSKNFVRLICA